MRNAAVTFATRSQLLLFAGMLISTVLQPEFFFSLDQGGISNYGVVLSTLPFYTFALLGCGYYMVRSALALPKTDETARDGRRILMIVGYFFILMLVSTYPYQISLTLTYIHQIISNMTVLMMLLAGVWMYRQLPRGGNHVYYLAALLFGVLLGLITIIDVVRLLFTAQIFVAIGFGGIYLRFIRAFDSATNKPYRNSTST